MWRGTPSGGVLPSTSLVLLAAIAAGAWLQPNHWLPWVSFHAEVWMAVVLCGVSLFVLARTQGALTWHGLAVLGLLLAAVPLVQLAGGLVLSKGLAWINSAYLLGLFAALMIGARWESAAPGEPVLFVLLAAFIASFLSVGLQLHQWMQLDGLPFLSMGGGPSRPSANIGQANHLATLHLWGLLAVTWAWLRGYFGPTGFFALAAFLLLGIALTESRAALLNGVLLCGVTWLYRPRWPSRRVVWAAMGLVFALLVLMLTLPSLGAVIHSFGESGTARLANPASANIRITAYTMLVDAALRQPWFGYGWGQTMLGQFAVALDHPSINGVLGNAHNLLIDLVLWLGIPGGLAVAMTFAAWLLRCLRVLRAPENVVVLMAVLVLAVHSMVEFPLQYGYFLWPAGLLVGALNVRANFPAKTWGHRALLAGICLACGAFTLAAIRDYVVAEASFRSWRFHVARIGSVAPEPIPSLAVLPQIESVLRVPRAAIRKGMTAEEINDYTEAMLALPSLANIFFLSQALAMNGRVEEARLWQLRMEGIFSAEHLAFAKADWRRQALSTPEMANLPWAHP
ncbi:MAG: O-antigen ligase C-terminal domain-containing protein [Burkholderiales bacterium]|nr:O-antigen ligase C-terminal domain-containing protein [Burkholderiales bacterium]